MADSTLEEFIIRISSDISELESGLKSAAGIVGNFAGLAVKGVGAVAGAFVGLGKEVVSQFGELEQNLGGSEAVFGQYAANVQKIGEEAYKNMGVSQSQYLATANKMGALFQGSGLEQEKAMDLTVQAMQRASDMASVMGIDMQMALDSVAGAAKGNFTMMDNLGVAMNATNIEAYALAQGLDFAWHTASQAEKAEVAMQMFFDNTQQYAGNFARESTETITGAFGLLQASANSLVAGLGDAEADIASLAGHVAEAFEAVVDNVVPIIENMTAAIPETLSAIEPAIAKLLPGLLDIVAELIDGVMNMLLKMAPDIIPIIANLVTNIADAITDMIPAFAETAGDIIAALMDGLTNALPALLTAAGGIIFALAQGLADNLPMIMDSAVSLLLTIVDTLLDNLDALIDAALAIIIALAIGISDALPRLIEKIPEIITKIVDTLFSHLGDITAAALRIIITLAAGIIAALPHIVTAVLSIPMSIIDGLFNTDWAEAGRKIITAVGEGLLAAGQTLLNAAANIAAKIKAFFTGSKETIESENAALAAAQTAAAKPAQTAAVASSGAKTLSGTANLTSGEYYKTVEAAKAAEREKRKAVHETEAETAKAVAKSADAAKKSDAETVASAKAAAKERTDAAKKSDAETVASAKAAAKERTDAALQGGGGAAAKPALNAASAGGANNFEGVGAQIIDSVGAGVETASDALLTRTEAIFKLLIAKSEQSFNIKGDLSGVFYAMGKAIIKGLTGGMLSSLEEAKAAAVNAAKSIAAAVSGALEIHSPSKVFERIGAFMGQGLEEGFVKSVSEIEETIKKAIPTDFALPDFALSGPAADFTNFQGLSARLPQRADTARGADEDVPLNGQVVNITINNPVIREEKDIETLTREIGREMARQINKKSIVKGIYPYAAV